MRVLITGAAGRLGQVLVPMLQDDPRITELIVHDWRPIAPRQGKIRVVCGDIRDPALGRAAQEADAVVHMAFVVIEGDLGRERGNRALARAINIDGTQALVEALRPEARLVQLSSASVYGTSGVPVTESAPLRPLEGFRYAEDKVRAEEIVIAAERDGLCALRLRPHIILGPHAQPFLRAVLRLPFYPRLPPPAPPLQVVHEWDVAVAIQAALFAQATGAVNLACKDTLSFEAMQRSLHRFVLGVDPTWAQRAARLAFRYLGIGPDPAWSAGLNRPLVLDSTRAREVLGWEPRFARAADVLADTFRRPVSSRSGAATRFR
ncbi:NAD-dependent epimerase/dehydratase family protein [Acidiferrobacter sp.]|uniref:NAD-dependent epimerase/dehydratase family protein n=1 Tax=Acidiferrobacter sp. TaxID=1872107 RepID=UPI00260DDB0E|nr:NAD-dependent epimerase/dehydratase family protein [Acidiferrobacter sp.]